MNSATIKSYKQVFFITFVLILFFQYHFVYSSQVSINSNISKKTYIKRISANITQSENNNYYDVVENVISGIKPSSISNNGIWNSNTRKIKWGHFNGNLNVDLSYKLNSESDNDQNHAILDSIIDSIEPDNSVEVISIDQSKIFYVSTLGDNNNNGSETAPWKSIQYAIEHIQSEDTLIVKEGVYYEPSGIQINNDKTPNICGTEDNLTTIQAQGKVYLYKTDITVQGTAEKPIQYLAINGLNVGDIDNIGSYPHGMMFEYANHISISNNSVYRCTFGVILKNSDSCNISSNHCLYNTFGIYCDSCSYINIINNICNKNSSGIYINSGRKNIIENNICTENVARGMGIRRSWAGIGIFSNSIDSIIIGNLLSNNKSEAISGNNVLIDAWTGFGINIMGDVGNSIIINNRLVDNSFYIYNDNITTNISVMNNIFYESPLTFRSAAMFNDEKIVTLANNVFYYSEDNYNHFYTYFIRTDIDYDQTQWAAFPYMIFIQNLIRHRGNDSEIVGGFNSRNIVFENNIFHSTQNYNYLMQFDNDSYQAQNIDYNFFTNNINSIANIDCEGQNNIISTDPYFRNTESKNFQLLNNSPCFNSGKNSIAMGIYSGDYAFLDSDCDGMPDYFEDKYFLSNSTQDDIADSDCDGLSNYYEFFWNLNPKDNDTDGDGLIDNSESNTNPLLADSDFDMLSDYEELYVYHTDPIKHDSDLDSIIDGEEVKGWINYSYPYITNPLSNDSDGDGVNDGAEKEHSSNPLISDTDNDGSPDKDEIYAGTDPNNPQSIFKVSTIEPIYENGTFIAFKITWQCSTDTSLNLSYKINHKHNNQDWAQIPALPEEITTNTDGTKSYIDYDPDLTDYNITLLDRFYKVIVQRN